MPHVLPDLPQGGLRVRLPLGWPIVGMPPGQQLQVCCLVEVTLPAHTDTGVATQGITHQLLGITAGAAITLHPHLATAQPTWGDQT